MNGSRAKQRSEGVCVSLQIWIDRTHIECSHAYTGAKVRVGMHTVVAFSPCESSAEIESSGERGPFNDYIRDTIEKLSGL